MANLDLMSKLFTGQTAHDVGGCFSPAMAKTKSYLSTGVEDLTVDEDEDEDENENEGSGDSETNKNEEDSLFPSSAAESHSPLKSVKRKSTRSTYSKRKSEGSIDSESKRRETSFDAVIELLKNNVVGSSSVPSKSQRISDILETMGVFEEKGDSYFVAAIEYLKDEKYADTFLALRNDNQRWIYLRKVNIEV